MTIGIGIFYSIATIPAQVATDISPSAIQALWSVILIQQMIPVGIIVLLFGSIIGAALGERYL